MNMKPTAKCVKAIQGEYITVGVEYWYTVHDNECVDYRRTSNGYTGSYMNKSTWDRAVASGAIEIIS